jgi:hypothetical protein
MQAQSHYNAAVLLAMKGDTVSAVTHLERALQIDPNYSDARGQLEKLRSRRRDRSTEVGCGLLWGFGFELRQRLTNIIGVGIGWREHVRTMPPLVDRGELRRTDSPSLQAPSRTSREYRSRRCSS